MTKNYSRERIDAENTRTEVWFMRKTKIRLKVELIVNRQLSKESEILFLFLIGDMLCNVKSCLMHQNHDLKTA